MRPVSDKGQMSILEALRTKAPIGRISPSVIVQMLIEYGTTVGVISNKDWRGLGQCLRLKA